MFSQIAIGGRHTGGVEILAGTVQNYDWGDREFIAALQGRTASGVHEAELWMGAHPSAPSRLSSGQALDTVIAQDPGSTLGAPAASRFGQLPFLMKVLAAAAPLSIQTHPSLSQASAGFERENEAGLEIDSPTRTYRDTNHKPELVCALTRFEAKCGLRNLDLTRELFQSLGEAVVGVTERLGQSGTASEVLADLVAWLLRMDSQKARLLVERTVEASASVETGPFAEDLAWSAELHKNYPGDIGVVVALLLNHVVLEPGQALFLPAGNIHSYLRGAGVEVMANSDNVVRGGLTAKHLDVEELLSIAYFEPLEPAVQTPSGSAHRYHSPTPEFSLTRIELDGPMSFQVTGPEILLVIDGPFEFTSAGAQRLNVGRGEPVWVPASEGSYVASGTGTLFRTTVG